MHTVFKHLVFTCAALLHARNVGAVLINHFYITTSIHPSIHPTNQSACLNWTGLD